MTFGERVKEFREKRNMTQQELADEVGITRSQISQIESGQRNASIPTGVRIAESLKVTLSELAE